MAEVTGMTPDRIAQEIKDNTWHNGPVPSTVQSMDELSNGSWGIPNVNLARDLGLPGNFGTLEIQQIANGKTATYISQKHNTQELSIWISSRGDAGWTPWEQLLKHAPQERLSGNIDLNTLKTPNTYGVAINSGVSNLPEGEENTSGVLEVLTTGSKGVQRLTTWGSSPKIYIRNQSTTGWYDWKLVYPEYFERLSGDVDLNTLKTPNTYGVAINSGVSNLPEGEKNTAGVLEVLTTGTRAVQRFITWGINPKIYIRNQSTTTNWYGWHRQIGEEDIEKLSSGGSPGLKTSAMTLTAHSLLDGVPGRYRILAQVTAPVTRFRIHIESRRMVSETTRDFTLNNVYIGRHVGNGIVTDLKTLKTGSTNISGTSEWVSDWIKYDLTSEVLVDFDVSGSNLLKYYAGGYVYEAGAWKPTTIVSAAVWLELETYSETPVVAMIGDSTGAGQGAEWAIHESALHMAARKHHFIPMNYSYPGSSMGSMNNIEHHIYKRWAGLSKPDSVIIQAGSNDIHAGNPIDELKTRFRNISKLAEGISPVVIATTVKARYPDSGDFQGTLDEYNQWIRTQPYESRDYLDFYQAVSPNGGTLLADKADAAHLNTSGHSKMASVFDNTTTSRPPADVEYKGVGSPEGKITAPVGTIYTDTAATNGAIRWIKTSGTSNTGWRVEYGDTGWRLIPNRNETQEGQIYIRRVVDTCFIRVSKYLDPGNYAKHIATIPVGFRPEGVFYGLIVDPGAGSTNSIIGSYSPGALSWTRDIDGGYERPSTTQSGEVAYSTTNSWPTSLPGTPA